MTNRVDNAIISVYLAWNVNNADCEPVTTNGLCSQVTAMVTNFFLSDWWSSIIFDLFLEKGFYDSNWTEILHATKKDLLYFTEAIWRGYFQQAKPV